jgi:glycosyltransferase involved in cell wall biosynthesis
MPTFNRARLLEEAIKSVIGQTFKDFEIIVCDNASTDSTQGIVKSFGDDRIVYVKNDHNIGVIKNWNKALGLSRGKYVTIFHDDDLMLPDNLMVKVAFLDQHAHVGMVHSNFQMIDEEGRVTQQYRSMGEGALRELDEIEQSGQALQRLLTYNAVHVCSAVFKRECYSELGGFTERIRLFPDWEYWMRIASRFPVGFVSKPLISWRSHSGSITEANLQRSSTQFAIGLVNLQNDLDDMRWLLGRYGPTALNRKRAFLSMSKLMGNRAADYAISLLRQDESNSKVREFLFRVCSRNPQIILQVTIWKVLLKSMLTQRALYRLRRLSPTRMTHKIY